MVFALGGELPRPFSEPLLPTFLSLPQGPFVSPGMLSYRSSSAGGTSTWPLGGECLGLTPRGNESPGQPFNYPFLKPFPPPLRVMGGTHQTPKGQPKGPQSPSGLPLAQLPSATLLCTSWGVLATLHCSSNPLTATGVPRNKGKPSRLHAWPVLP